MEGSEVGATGGFGEGAVGGLGKGPEGEGAVGGLGTGTLGSLWSWNGSKQFWQNGRLQYPRGHRGSCGKLVVQT